MFTLCLQKLFGVLEAIPGLQRKDWEQNQSGADRAMEAVLIQRAPREVATYALVRLRLAAMPELGTSGDAATWAPEEVQQLLAWSQSQGSGGTMLAKVVSGENDRASSHRARAALASLRYYHRRDDANPGVKDLWTAEGLDRIASIDVASFLEYPTRGPIWCAKFETVQRLVEHVRQGNTDDVSDDAISTRSAELRA